MKRIYSVLFILLLFLSSLTKGFSQSPEIYTLSKKHAATDETLFLTGKNFSNTKTELQVGFGAASGEIIRSTTNLIEVKVPSGATFGSVSVTNLITGLTGYSTDLFDLSFSGRPFTVSAMAGQTDFTSETGLFDLCKCDFDGDGKTDIATSNTSNGISSIYRNTSEPGTVAFVKTTINFNVPLYSVSCRDLDGDGKPELLAARTGSNSVQIFVAKNNSTPGNIVFGTPVPYNIVGNNPAKIVVRDLDGDGKPEIIVTNRFNNQLSIFRNNSTPGVIIMDANPVTLVLPPNINTQGLSVDDLNGDGLPDIVASASNGNQLFIIQNRSSYGNFNFHNHSEVQLNGVLINLAIGDLNQDGYPEIAVTNTLDHNISLLKNSTSSRGGTIQFENPTNIATVNNPWGICMGDLDGDGKTDLIVASTSAAMLTYLKNESTSGVISLTKHDLPITERSRNIVIGDIDGDGKPDLSFTSTSTNKLSVKRNGNCLLNTISPSGPLTMCEGADLRLTTPSAKGATYIWKKDNIDFKTGEEPFLDINEAGSYTVTVSEAGGSCVSTSTSVTVTIVTEALPEPPVASSNSPVCTGDRLRLSAGTVTGAIYTWTGPNGFSSTLQNPEIATADFKTAGVYFLTIKKGSCQSATVNTVVEIKSINPQTIEANGATSFCEGNDVVLSVPSMTGFEYLWKKNGSVITEATSSSYQAGEPGNYSVVLTKEGCNFETPAVQVEVFTPPIVSFTAPEIVCVTKSFSLTNTSEVAAGANAQYFWDFGDGTTATSKDATHQFAANGQYLVKLGISYGADECFEEFARNIRVESSIDLEIISDLQDTPCEGDIVTLSVTGEYAQYLWSTGSTSPTLQVSESGTYTLDVETAEGCTGTGAVTIDFLSAPVVEITSETKVIGTGESIRLLATGAFNYTWFPVEGLSNPDISDPIASPASTTTYKVVGTAANGCSTEEEITIQVLNTVNVNPKKIFSPNGDQIEDYWVIEKIENYQSCQLEIFDRQGARIFQSKPYHNNWDGTLNGKPVMEGVYFYVLKCDEGKKAGSITLIR